MDPVATLATITAGATVLATEVSRGLAGAAGRNAWEAIKGKLGWDEEPQLDTMVPQLVQALRERPEVAKDILGLLEHPQVGMAQQLVGTLSAEKVVVANEIHGGVQMK